MINEDSDDIFLDVFSSDDAGHIEEHRLFLYAADSLPQPDVKEIDAHLILCRACRTVVARKADALAWEPSVTGNGTPCDEPAVFRLPQTVGLSPELKPWAETVPDAIWPSLFSHPRATASMPGRATSLLGATSTDSNASAVPFFQLFHHAMRNEWVCLFSRESGTTVRVCCPERRGLGPVELSLWLCEKREDGWRSSTYPVSVEVEFPLADIAFGAVEFVYLQDRAQQQQVAACHLVEGASGKTQALIVVGGPQEAADFDLEVSYADRSTRILKLSCGVFLPLEKQITTARVIRSE